MASKKEERGRDRRLDLVYGNSLPCADVADCLWVLNPSRAPAIEEGLAQAREEGAGRQRPESKKILGHKKVLDDAVCCSGGLS